jgi:2-polyprenyl-3-methyl-5-hydroxy-6-metoxy-1,4-benzoquinol methylase
VTSLKYDFERRDVLEFIPRGIKTVADIGCGSGAFGRVLREERAPLEMWALEPDVSSAQAAQAHFDRVIVGRFPEDASALPSGMFDCVVFNDVLEHMIEPERALLEAKRLLAPEGIVVASIPNIRYVGVLGPLLFRDRFEYTELGILDRTHVRFFTRSSIVELFQKLGYQIHFVAGVGRRRRYRVLGRALFGRADAFLFPQYVVVAR